MANLTKKIEELSKKYAQEVNKIFPDEEPIVLLYGSSVEGVENSDLDVCTILHNYNREDEKKIKDITVKFHIDNNMKIDNEVPFESKAIYSYFDIEKMLMKPPFQIFRRKFYIPEIEKSEEFLSSINVKYRLLLYALTANSIVISGNKKNIRNL